MPRLPQVNLYSASDPSTRQATHHSPSAFPRYPTEVSRDSTSRVDSATQGTSTRSPPSKLCDSSKPSALWGDETVGLPYTNATLSNSATAAAGRKPGEFAAGNQNNDEYGSRAQRRRAPEEPPEQETFPRLKKGGCKRRGLDHQYRKSHRRFLQLCHADNSDRRHLSQARTPSRESGTTRASPTAPQYPSLCATGTSTSHSPLAHPQRPRPVGHGASAPTPELVFGLGTCGLRGHEVQQRGNGGPLGMDGAGTMGAGRKQLAGAPRQLSPTATMATTSTSSARGARSGGRGRGKSAVLPTITNGGRHHPHDLQQEQRSGPTRPLTLPPSTSSVREASDMGPPHESTQHGGGSEGGVLDVFGYFATHRVHPEYYQQLLQAQETKGAAREAERRRNGHGFAAHAAAAPMAKAAATPRSL